MKRLCGIVLVIGLFPAVASAVEWTKFNDPGEGAFSLEVPAGWQVVGGIKRLSVNQPHPVVGVLSPDKLTKIVLGDPAAIAYGELTGQMRALGFREGQSYRPHGEPEIVRNYRTGTEWSAELAQRELQQDDCTNVKVVRQQAIPALNRGLPMPQGVEHRDTAGETYLTCVRQNILYAAYGFSETAGDYYYQGNQVIAGVWTDDTSVVLLTPQGLGAQAMAVAGHMLNTMQWNPAWWQRQFHATVAQSNALYAQATKAIAQQGASWDRTIRGVEQYTNPQTGKRVEVPISGAESFAQNAAGDIIGLVGANAPPAGFTMLKKGPH